MSLAAAGGGCVAVVVIVFDAPKAWFVLNYGFRRLRDRLGILRLGSWSQTR